jgi:hypothetical protein
MVFINTDRNVNQSKQYIIIMVSNILLKILRFRRAHLIHHMVAVFTIHIQLGKNQKGKS